MTLDEFVYNFAWNMHYDDQENFDKEKTKYPIYVAMALHEDIFDSYTVGEILDMIQEKIWKIRGEI